MDTRMGTPGARRLIELCSLRLEAALIQDSTIPA